MFRIATLIDLLAIAENKNQTAMASEFCLKKPTFYAYFYGNRFQNKDVFPALRKRLASFLFQYTGVPAERIEELLDQAYLEEKSIREMYFSTMQTLTAFTRLAYEIIVDVANQVSASSDDFTPPNDAREILSLYGKPDSLEYARLITNYLLQRIAIKDGYISINVERIAGNIVEQKGREVKKQPLPLDKMLGSDLLGSGLLRFNRLNLDPADAVSAKLLRLDGMIDLKFSTAIDIFLYLVKEKSLYTNSERERFISCSVYLPDMKKSIYEINAGVPLINDYNE